MNQISETECFKCKKEIKLESGAYRFAQLTYCINCWESKMPDVARLEMAIRKGELILDKDTKVVL